MSSFDSRLCQSTKPRARRGLYASNMQNRHTLDWLDRMAQRSRELLTGRKLPENFIVVPDEERENRSALDDIVEVGLKHELLSSGIELIDSPGKSESDVLDRVLDEFLMKGTVPLFVYVIDGNMHLRSSVSLYWARNVYVSFI